LGIRSAWEKSLEREGHYRDPAQAGIIDRFEALQRSLEESERSRSLADRMLRRQPRPVRGLYLWGSVGRGKTFLMDLFFETLAVERKLRVHFHRMMQDVHARMNVLADVADPLDRVAADIARETRVLCFDEFFVSDIADAMILGRLLDGLFRRGLTLVATSNLPPADLYRDGLQRAQFLPAIDLLEARTDVVELGGDTDYRLRLLEAAGTYLVPDDTAARQRLDRLFRETAFSRIENGRQLLVNGRHIEARRCSQGIAWFDFEAVCAGPRSQSDYIELARWYPTVIVSGVPRFDTARENEARRFIALVDEFYDRRVKLILSAAAEPAALYTGDRLVFEFERTRSRLMEMQTSEYLARPHLG
jgi:cell division protein ZapE